MSDIQDDRNSDRNSDRTSDRNSDQNSDQAQGPDGPRADVGRRLTGEHDPRDPDGLLTVDQIAGGAHGASPEEGLRVPRGDRIEEPTAED